MEPSPSLAELVAHLSLERIEDNLFRGQSKDPGWGIVYGGQVLGQALSAATQTVPGSRAVHSLHAYFLRPGDVSKPIIYDVDRIRDGGSFTTRRVVAIQSGQPIFNLAASFHQAEEDALEHHAVMPEVPAPETVPSEQERAVALGDALPKVVRDRAMRDRPFEVRPIHPIENPMRPAVHPPLRNHWFRTTGPVDGEPALHRALLAYASDYLFLTATLLPHGVSWLSGEMQIASLDHVMWFHRPFRADEWLLHAVESPTAQGSRGFVRGQIFSRDGTLVASTCQEGLLRKRTKAGP